MSVNNIFRLLPLWKENVNVAVKAIKSNRLRSFFTIIIIATGIASLVGILTAIEAVKKAKDFDIKKVKGLMYQYYNEI